jgi:hypothetical protein
MAVNRNAARHRVHYNAVLQHAKCNKRANSRTKTAAAIGSQQPNEGTKQRTKEDPELATKGATLGDLGHTFAARRMAPSNKGHPKWQAQQFETGCWLLQERLRCAEEFEINFVLDLLLVQRDELCNRQYRDGEEHHVRNAILHILAKTCEAPRHLFHLSMCPLVETHS